MGVLILTGGFVASRHMTSSQAPEGQVGLPLPQVATATRAPHRRDDASVLAAKHRIDPGTVRPLAGRAFNIERPRERRPPGDAALFAKTLVPAAGRGEAAASYRLYLIAAECDSAVSPEVVETYRMTRHLLAPDYAARMTRQLEECEGLLTDPALSDRRHWLTLAAAQGSPEAAIVYAASIEEALGGPGQWAKHPEQVTAYKQQAMNYLFNGAAQGYVGALSSLSRAYESGFLTPADPVKALAYRRVVQQVDPSPGSEGLARRLEEGLSVRQRSDARRQAAVIREECCVNLEGAGAARASHPQYPRRRDGTDADGLL
jgi:hypothetical protein